MFHPARKSLALASVVLLMLVAAIYFVGTSQPAAASQSGSTQAMSATQPQLPANTNTPALGCWTESTPYPTAVSDAAVVSLGGFIYSFGGQGADIGSTSTAYKFDGSNWTAISPLPGSRAGSAIATDGANIYLVGGFRGGVGTLTETLRYDPATDTYTQLASPEDPSAFQPAVYLNGKIYRIGGSPALSNFDNVVEVYDIATNTWSRAADYPTNIGDEMAMTMNGYIYAAGGLYGPAVNKTYRYDPTTNLWDDSSITDLPNYRAGSASAIIGGEWLLAGGADGQASAVAWNPTTNVWNNISSMIYARSSAAGATLGNAFYAIGGYDGGIKYNNNQRYSPNCTTDTPTPTVTGTPPTNTPTQTAIPSETSTQTFTPSVTPTSTSTPTPQPTVCPNPFVDISGDVFFYAINYLYCHGAIDGVDATHYNPTGLATRAEFAKVVVVAFAVPLTTPASGQTFTDVPPTYFAYVYIESAYAAGIVSGYNDNTCTQHGVGIPCYLPQLPITRGQLTKLVVNAAHFPLVTPSGGQTFTDVPPTNVFYTSIETAFANGVVHGYSVALCTAAGQGYPCYLPNNNIRRDEMSQIVYAAQLTAPTATPTVTGTPPTATPTFTPTPTITGTPPTDTPTLTNTPGNPTVTPTDCPNPFIDIAGDLYYAAIHYLNCRGVVDGTDATHFSPTLPASRAVVSKAIALGFGIPFYTPSTQDFVDVPPSYFAYIYIESGYHAGVLNGEDQATCNAHGQNYPCFLPDANISRAEIAKYTVLAAQYQLYTPTSGQDFTDVPPSDPFYTYIETAYHHGVMDGYPDHTFRPANPVQRDEMCQIIYNGITLP